MCEPLKGKRVRCCGEFDKFESKDVTSAYNFYKRYRVMPHLLKEEDNKIFNEWVSFANKNNICPWFTRKEFEAYDFQCWLFDYTFQDVIKNV